MTTIISPIALEAANSNVKGTAGNGKEVIYTNTSRKVGSTDNIKNEMKQLGSDEFRKDLYLYENESGTIADYYEVGVDRRGDDVKTSFSTPDVGRYLTFEYKIETLIGIYKLIEGTQYEEEVPKFFLTTGIPADHYERKLEQAKANITSNLVGIHKINGMKFEIVEVEVVLQPMATFFREVCLPDGRFSEKIKEYENKTILIVDAGFGTTDFLPIEKLQRKTSKKRTGIKHAFEYVKDNITELDSETTPHKIDADWRDGNTNFIGNPGDNVLKTDEKVQKVFDEAFKEFAGIIVGGIKEGFDFNSFHEIWFTGGASQMVFDKVLEVVNNDSRFKLVDNPQIANAEGYLKIANRKVRERLSNGVTV